jgi:two-component system, LuxR family, sensor kinase FixL
MKRIAIDELASAIVADDIRALDIVQRMRVLLARGEIQRRRLTVADFINDVLASARGIFIDQKVRVSTRLDERIQAIGDPVDLEQVLLNLLLNACESMSGSVPPERRIEVIATPEPDHDSVCISVLDEGAGIEPDHLDRIFDPFFTTKESGLGLGLAICRAVIVAHQGRLWAANRSDRGAAFHFTVPLARMEDDGQVAHG